VSHVFISYANPDRFTAHALATHLTDRGVTVWWDFELYAGDDFHDAILASIDAATAVIVIWSPTARASQWVRSEASRAQRQQKLIPTLAPGATLEDIPLPFDQLQCVPVLERDKIFRSLQRLGVGSTPNPALPALPAYLPPAKPRKPIIKPLLQSVRQAPSGTNLRDLIDIAALGQAIPDSTAEEMFRGFQGHTLLKQPSDIHGELKAEFEDLRGRYRLNKNFKKALDLWLDDFERDFKHRHHEGHRLSDFLKTERQGKAYLFLVHMARRRRFVTD
jgi:hypothetical protein